MPTNFKLQNRIFLVSSRAAMLYRRKQDGEILTSKMESEVPNDINETGFPELEESIGYFLANEKGTAKIRRYVRDSKNIFGMMKHDLLINIGVVSHSTDEIRQKVSSMEARFTQANLQANKIIGDMKENFQIAGTNIESQCKAAAQSILMKAKATVNDLDKSMSDSEMKNRIEHAVSSEKKNFIDTTIKNWQSIFDREYLKTSNELKNIWHDIDLEYQREFNFIALMESGSTSIEISVDRSESFYESASRYMGRVFDSGISLFGRIGNLFGAVASAVGGLINDVWDSFNGRNDAKKDWRDKICNTIDKTYSSLDKEMISTLSKQYKQKSEEMCNNFQASVNARIKDMDIQLKNILREKESKEQDATRQKNYLQQKQNELQQIENTLNSLID